MDSALRRWRYVLLALFIVAALFLYKDFQTTFATLDDISDILRPVAEAPVQHAAPLYSDPAPEPEPAPLPLPISQPQSHVEDQLPLFDDELVDALTPEQCDQAFPDLYHDIDRAVSYWQQRQHTISEHDVDVAYREEETREDGSKSGGGAMRILIHENELRILEGRTAVDHLGYRGRVMGSLNLLQRAVDSATAGGEKLPTIEAALLFQDNSDPPDDEGTETFWTYAANIHDERHQRLWLMPNFDFWYAFPMGSYKDSRRRASQYDAAFANKIQKLVWRGSEWVNWDLRGGLVRATENKDWADVMVVEWGGADHADGLSVEELCQYAMTVHTEGISYSGRLKYLLNCDSVPVIHELDWTTYYSHLLEKDGPNQNYISVKRDWSDLEEKVQYYLEHPSESEKIIQNSLATFRNKYLTRAATSCYLRRLIQGYANVSYTPDVFRPSNTGLHGQVRDLRGRSFERFMDAPQDYLEENA